MFLFPHLWAALAGLGAPNILLVKEEGPALVTATWILLLLLLLLGVVLQLGLCFFQVLLEVVTTCLK